MHHCRMTSRSNWTSSPPTTAWVMRPVDVALSFAQLVATSAAVGSTRARSAKIAALAELLGKADADEIETAVAFLTGEPRFGKIGVGWATLSAASKAAAAAESPSLTVA